MVNNDFPRMDEQTKEDGGIDPAQQYEDEDDDDFDPFLHAVVPRNLYHKFQIEGSKRWGPPTEILPFLFLGYDLPLGTSPSLPPPLSPPQGPSPFQCLFPFFKKSFCPY